jgi:hypothetical protein
MTTANNIRTGSVDQIGRPIPGAAQADPWQANNGQEFRLIYETRQGIADRPDVTLFLSAVQLGDGTIDNGDQLEPPVLYVEVQDGRGLTAVQARALSTALVNAAAQLDRWERFRTGD